jgi:hypothetical protein
LASRPSPALLPPPRQARRTMSSLIGPVRPHRRRSRPELLLSCRITSVPIPLSHISPAWDNPFDPPADCWGGPTRHLTGSAVARHIREACFGAGRASGPRALFVGPALGDGYAKCRGTATPCHLEQSTRDLKGRAHGSLLSGGVAVAAHAFNPQPDPPGRPIAVAVNPHCRAQRSTTSPSSPPSKQKPLQYQNSEASPDAFPLPASRRRAPRSVSRNRPQQRKGERSTNVCDPRVFLVHRGILCQP